MKNLPACEAKFKVAAHQGAADNTKAEVVLAADDDTIHVLHSIEFSYDEAPSAAATIQVVSTGTDTIIHYVVVGGPQQLFFPMGLPFVKGAAVTVTLAAEAGLKGALSVQYR